MTIENAIERYDRLAEEFYRETGMMAPGKDVAAMGDGGGTMEERSTAWNKWLTNKDPLRADGKRDRTWIAIVLAGDEPPEFKRASPLAECSTCGKTYQKHQIYEWGEGSTPLYLYRTCEGSYWKL